MGPEPPHPPGGGAVPKGNFPQVNRCWQQALQTTNFLNSCHLTSDCPMPRQTLHPSWQGHSHACSIKRERNWVGVGDLSPSSGVPAQASLHGALRSQTVHLLHIYPYIPTCSEKLSPCLLKDNVKDTFLIKIIYIFPQVADIKENHQWKFNIWIIEKKMHLNEIRGLDGMKISLLISWFWWWSFCLGRRMSLFVRITN